MAVGMENNICSRIANMLIRENREYLPCLFMGSQKFFVLIMNEFGHRYEFESSFFQIWQNSLQRSDCLRLEDGK